ncbi:hypothetical protein SAMN05216570_3326 [Dyella sp. OK004]|nr:hypothetical protein SAMN05216570_3326 [Dyella sp. OK004]
MRLSKAAMNPRGGRTAFAPSAPPCVQRATRALHTLPRVSATPRALSRETPARRESTFHCSANETLHA